VARILRHDTVCSRGFAESGGVSVRLSSVYSDILKH